MLAISRVGAGAQHEHRVRRAGDGHRAAETFADREHADQHGHDAGDARRPRPPPSRIARGSVRRLKPISAASLCEPVASISSPQRVDGVQTHGLQRRQHAADEPEQDHETDAEDQIARRER